MTNKRSSSMSFWKRAIKFVRSHKKERQVQSGTKNRMKFIKIYGERNTGTHFAQRMIRQNFHFQLIPGTLAEACPGYREKIEEEIKSRISDPAKQLWVRQTMMDAYFQGNLWGTLGWKHSVPPINAILNHPDIDNILFVTLLKNPYAWAISLLRRPYENLCINHPQKLVDLIDEPWPTVTRDNAPAILQSPIQLWNIKAEGYARLAKIATVVRCRYEEILIDQNNFLELISNYLERKTDDFIIETDATKKYDKGKKDLNYYREYYLKEHWRDELTSVDIDLINKFLDPEVVNEAGYEMIEPNSVQ